MLSLAGKNLVNRRSALARQSLSFVAIYNLLSYMKKVT